MRGPEPSQGGRRTSKQSSSEDLRAALVLQDTASHHRLFNFLSEHERLVADKAAFDVSFCMYRAHICTKFGCLQTYLIDLRKRAN